MDLIEESSSFGLGTSRKGGLRTLPPELLSEILEWAVPDGFISAALSCKAMYALAQPMIQDHNHRYQAALCRRRSGVEFLCQIAQGTAGSCNIHYYQEDEEPWRREKLIELRARVAALANECLGSKIQCEVDDWVDDINLMGQDLLDCRQGTDYPHWISRITKLDRSLAKSLPVNQYFARRTLATRYRLFGFSFLALLRGLKSLTIGSTEHHIHSQAGELASLVDHWQGNTYFQHLQQLRISQDGYPDVSFVLTSLLQLPSLEILQLEDTATSPEEIVVHLPPDDDFTKFRAPLTTLILCNISLSGDGLDFLRGALPYLDTRVVDMRNGLSDPHNRYLRSGDWQAKFELAFRGKNVSGDRNAIQSSSVGNSEDGYGIESSRVGGGRGSESF